ncbi:MAG: MerR family transcriptional regulator [Alphaproteobacteria bacterium]|nr:MerR family transcriptional regulator [Alphaproteobacteria bacterium]
MDHPLTPAETARRIGVSIKALRLYERHGLLTPLRSRSGWRTYGPEQIARLHQILALKSLGLPLASIGRVLASTQTLDAVLAMQDQALAQENRRIAKASAMIRAARAKLRCGQTLSIDDLINLNKETSMASKLTRSTYFHPALVPHQHKYFRPEEIEALASREDFDQERDIAIWYGLFDELKKLASAGDPGSPAALDLARRWLAQGETVSRGDPDIAGRIRNMVRDALADPATAPQMPFSASDLLFLEKVVAKLKQAGS